jgi:hypothetical protein
MRSGFWWSRPLAITIYRRGGNKRILNMEWQGIFFGIIYGRRGKVVGYFELILFLVLRCHYSPTRAFAFLMDFSKSALFF